MHTMPFSATNVVNIIIHTLLYMAMDEIIRGITEE
jgi:hypothetical protein